jgi:hypothetical protein
MVFSNSVDSDIDGKAASGKTPIGDFIIFGHAAGNAMFGTDSSPWFEPSKNEPNENKVTYDLARGWFLPRRCWFTKNATARSVGCDSERFGRDFADQYLRTGAHITTTTKSVRPWCDPSHQDFSARGAPCYRYDGVEFATSWTTDPSTTRLPAGGPFTSPAAFHGATYWSSIPGAR